MAFSWSVVVVVVVDLEQIHTSLLLWYLDRNLYDFMLDTKIIEFLILSLFVRRKPLKFMSLSSGLL